MEDKKSIIIKDILEYENGDLSLRDENYDEIIIITKEVLETLWMLGK